ncbi:hypothetical protein [Schlesneria sp. T3-172]|uniref:hypothetical protein n=2 Tax=Schlesneria TaxID=656899 RepID=UPI0037C9628C
MLFKQKTFIFFIAIGLLSGLTRESFAESAPTISEPRVGWNDHYLVGRWSPIVVPVSLTESAAVQLEVSALDPDGNRVTYQAAPVTLDAGDHQLEGLFKAGRLDGEISVRLKGGNDFSGTPGRAPWLKPAVSPAAKLVVTVGSPAGFDFDKEESASVRDHRWANVSAADLPTNPLAYDGVAALVLSGSVELTEAQSTAIRDWVAGGGRLTISFPRDVAAARKRLFNWVPATIGESSATVREFGSLESFAGKNIRIPQTEPLAIPHVQYPTGETLASSRSIPFLVRLPYGMGSVTLLTMDLTSAPLKDWKALHPFCARLVGIESRTELAEKMGSRGSQLSSTGISDVATQLHAIQDHFEKVNRTSPWSVLGGLLGLLLLIGPLDYLLVHRLLKRPTLTWVTFPLTACAVTVGAALLASSSNGSVARANQLNIINYDQASSTLRSRYFVNLYSPQTAQSSLKILPHPITSSATGISPANVSWNGVAESGFGGMLRPSGLERGAAYEHHADGELSNIPVLQWSSKALTGESLQTVEDLVECNLKATATGSLTGTILHRFDTPIEDWMIVFQNRVYRHLKTRDDAQSLPLAPKQVWRVEQPSVFQRELRPYLTGILTMATARFGSRTTKEIVQQQSTYNTLSLDPFEVVRILTFFDEVSGDRYTGLTNLLLNQEDCSHLLKLGRAVLFGRLRQPIAGVELNQQPLEPDSEASFVRLILPVEKSTEVLKELKRVVPD